MIQKTHIFWRNGGHAGGNHDWQNEQSARRDEMCEIPALLLQLHLLAVRFTGVGGGLVAEVRSQCSLAT